MGEKCFKKCLNPEAQGPSHSAKCHVVTSCCLLGFGKS